jgi:short-subunit dehydrogenase
MLVVITGASQGIGYAVAEAFAAEGHSLCICSKTAARLKEATESLVKKFPKATIHSMQADLAKPDDCKTFGTWCLSFGTPSILINNAGFFLPGNLMEEEQGILESQIAANLYSAYHTSRAITPAMIKVGSGHVFNICSIASLQAYTHGGSYSISKYAPGWVFKKLKRRIKM